MVQQRSHSCKNDEGRAPVAFRDREYKVIAHIAMIRVPDDVARE